MSPDLREWSNPIQEADPELERLLAEEEEIERRICNYVTYKELP